MSATRRCACTAVGIAAVLWTGCAATLPATPPVSVELGRFMREMVNVPFSFAMLEDDGRQRPLRVQRAALVLQDAARDLVLWEDPPVSSDAARDVFFTYARSLEHQVHELETASRRRDVAGAAHRLETIRQTCNGCHRFFRPVSSNSADVGYDPMAVEIGGAP